MCAFRGLKMLLLPGNFLLLALLGLNTIQHSTSHLVIGPGDTPFMTQVNCSLGVTSGKCGRAVFDDFVSPEEVSALHDIASTAMRGATETAGPLIMDINTGYIFGAGGLRNMYTASGSKRVAFSPEQYSTYRRVVMRVQSEIAKQFQAQPLLTAPTFLTRIVGSADWQPKSDHDEYFHYHGE